MDSGEVGIEAPLVERRNPESRARELALVRRVTERLVSSLDFRDALTTLVDGATELLGVERGSLLLLDPESKTLRIEVARGIDPKVVERTRIALGQGIAGTVAASGEAIVTSDVRQLPGFSSNPEQVADYTDFSALCVPLVLHGRVLGVMNFNHKRSGLPFVERDLEFALLIANQASVVLWSAQLHREYLGKQILDRELEIARSIQERLLPRELPEQAGFTFTAEQRMCQGVGGDYYDLFRAPDGQVVIAVGDVAGHGVGSALVAAQVRATLRECLARGDGLGATLARVSDQVFADTAPGMYLTMILGMLDPTTNFLEFVSAGHHMPVLLREGRVVRLPRIGKNLPLGLRRGQSFQPEWPLGLRSGDLLLLFTDGIWEAEDAADRHFGDAGIARTLQSNLRATGAAMLQILFDAVMCHAGTSELEDDCTLVLLGVD